jgi:spore coat polysaccharide biosynthesis protein SpsF
VGAALLNRKITLDKPTVYWQNSENECSQNSPQRNERNMKYLVTIEARMRSSRLPGKVLKPILGRPMLALMIERLQQARTIDGIVVATTINPSDDPIAELAGELEVGCFRGSEEDVLARVLGAARSYGGDVIVETTGDCPLNDPAIVDKVVSDYRIGGADFVSNTLQYSTPIGTDVRVFSSESLAEINRISKDPADHEHVSLHYWEHPEKYRLRNVATGLPPEVADLRLTVDTPEDFELVRQVFEELYPVKRIFSLSDILELFRRRPDLPEINRAVRQKAVR